MPAGKVVKQHFLTQISRIRQVTNKIQKRFRPFDCQKRILCVNPRKSWIFGGSFQRMFKGKVEKKEDI